MANDVKINIYLKGREKPVTFHDKITDDDTFQSKVDYFFDILKGKNKGVSVIDFSDDNLVIPMESIEFVIVSKPQLDESATIMADEEEQDDSPLNMLSDDETGENDIIEDKEASIEVID